MTELKADIPPSHSAKGTTGGRRGAVTGAAEGEGLGMPTLYGASRRSAVESGTGRHLSRPGPIGIAPVPTQERRQRLP